MLLETLKHISPYLQTSSPYRLTPENCRQSPQKHQLSVQQPMLFPDPLGVSKLRALVIFTICPAPITPSFWTSFAALRGVVAKLLKEIVVHLLTASRAHREVSILSKTCDLRWLRLKGRACASGRPGHSNRAKSQANRAKARCQGASSIKTRLDFAGLDSKMDNGVARVEKFEVVDPQVRAYVSSLVSAV